ncbi:unnamed protein product [Paramecium pentaurelia]|uniref:Uncharacterized protein n=1 Tax=Paramecium pentaurelia TaxID=43138 RepID=A0A8S1V3X7_9CILI|nr:unnamed protein product [Paramecium pentaurelia]
MINQNNSKSFVAVNRSLTNKNVQEFIRQDLKKLRRKKKNLDQLFQEVEEIAQISLSKNHSEEIIDEDDQDTIELINQTYQLKKQELEQNSSQNSSRILPNVLSKQKSDRSLRESKDISKLTSITKIHITQNDDSLISDKSIKLKKTSYTQRNIKTIRHSDQHSKTQPKVRLLSKKQEIQTTQNDEKDKLPLIWQQYYNIQPETEKVEVKNSFLKLNDQFKKMREQVLEPFLKDQKLKVKLMTPLIIRKDKPYFVAENKDNKNLIDNMKNENTNLNRDEYLIVSYEHILDYI